VIPPDRLAERLRLIVITDAATAGSRSIPEIVSACLSAGAPAIQLRDKTMGAGELVALGTVLRSMTREHDALLFVNDRVDVALAVGADGVHLGPDDLPVQTVRRIVPPGFLIGFSTDEVDGALQAVADGADYLGCGTVWPTGSKADSGDSIGPDGLDRVARAVPLPVVGIGGITSERAAILSSTRAAGVAAIGAIMGAPDPGQATAAFLTAFPRSDRTASP